MVIEYPALIDGKDGAYGVAFPDLPGIVAMGDTRDEAISNAAEGPARTTPSKPIETVWK